MFKLYHLRDHVVVLAAPSFWVKLGQKLSNILWLIDHAVQFPRQR